MVASFFPQLFEIAYTILLQDKFKLGRPFLQSTVAYYVVHESEGTGLGEGEEGVGEAFEQTFVDPELGTTISSKIKFKDLKLDNVLFFLK